MDRLTFGLSIKTPLYGIIHNVREKSNIVHEAKLLRQTS